MRAQTVDTVVVQLSIHGVKTCSHVVTGTRITGTNWDPAQLLMRTHMFVGTIVQFVQQEVVGVIVQSAVGLFVGTADMA